MSTLKAYGRNGTPDLDTMCRLCLQPESATINIFVEGLLSIPVRIMACAALEVQASDGLPKLICEKCRFQLEKSYYFRKKCQLSDAKLRKHIRLLNAGKKSRVFLRVSEGDDDDDEDELQFEESLKFILDEEEKQQREEDERRARWLEEQQEQFRKEETQRLFEEFGNFMSSRKPIDRKVALKKERIEFEIKEISPPKIQPMVTLPKPKVEEVKFKRPRTKVIPRRGREQNTVVEADNEITSPEQMQDETEQILIYNDEDGENTDGSIQTFFLYGKNDEEGNSQIIEIESERLDDLEDELNREDDGDAVEEVNLDLGAHDENESDDFMFASEYDGSDNRDEDGHRMNSVNIVQSYQIEENGDIQYLKDEVPTETLSISDDDEDQNIVDNTDGPQFQIEQTIVVPVSKPKLKRKTAESKSGPQQEKKPLTTPTVIAVNYAKISTEDLKIFKCSECPQSFTRENSLLRHSSAHKKGRQYSCGKCDKWFSCKSSLDRHIRIHTGEKPFTCDQCGKSYMQKEVLKRHLAIHSGERPHPCPHCPRAFVQKLMLTQHINATHLEVPQIQKHDCHLCTKSFHHASGLSRHLITHSGMKFRCSECGRSFNDKSSIRRHVIAVHSKAMDKTTIVATKVSPKEEKNDSPTDYIL